MFRSFSLVLALLLSVCLFASANNDFDMASSNVFTRFESVSTTHSLLSNNKIKNDSFKAIVQLVSEECMNNSADKTCHMLHLLSKCGTELNKHISVHNRKLTVFVPSDKAFEASLEFMDNSDNHDVMCQMVKYHVAKGFHDVRKVEIISI